jgi:rhamnogalacturonyl hydrolase YesR
MDIGNSNHWQLNEGKNKYHADDFCVAQMYLEMYKMYGTREIILPTLSKADYTIINPSQVPLWVGVDKGQERWSWCDALFMAPPVYAGLYSITGNGDYLEFLDREFKACVDSLYDRSEHLFYRDRNYKDKKENNGEKVFWGRGNGWVLGGIASVLRYLPKSHRSYGYYADIFREMATSIIQCQNKNGYWNPSMLDPESFPDQENSATGLLTYGLAWGINNGLLDESSYKNPVMNAWNSMVSCVLPEGKLGYVQKVGSKPDKIYKDSTEIYGNGAFLLAGAEIYKLLKREGLQKAEIVEKANLEASPATYSFIKHGFLEDQVDRSNVIFGSAEYMKDGLFTEWLGESPWSDRLLEILNDLHKLTTVTAKITGEFGGGVPGKEINPVISSFYSYSTQLSSQLPFEQFKMSRTVPVISLFELFWKRERKLYASSLNVSDCYFSFVQQHSILHNRKSKTGSSLFS